MLADAVEATKMNFDSEGLTQDVDILDCRYHSLHIVSVLIISS